MINFNAFFCHENREREPFYEYIEKLPLEGWTLENLGVSEDDRYDIYGMKLNSNVEGKPYFFIRSAVHGDEWTTAYYAKYFAKFIGNPDLAPHDLVEYFVKLKFNYNWYWIPIHNPWGYENDRRENSNGVNLNDDLGEQSQLETIYLVEKFNEYKPISIIDCHNWDHHSTPCHAMSIYRPGQYDRTVCREVLFNSLDNLQFVTRELVNEYTSSGHDPTKFRSWSARRQSSSGENCMSWLIETDRLASFSRQMTQGFNALFIFCLYTDIWFRKGIQNPVKSDF